MRFQINCYTAGALAGFPEQTYEADTVPAVTACLTKVLLNPNSGIARVEVVDARFGGERLPVMSPQRVK